MRYFVVSVMKMGKNSGQKPWVEFNGVETEESSMIIKVLSKELGKEIEGLSKDERNQAELHRILITDAMFW